MKLNITGGNRGNSSDSAFYCSDNTQRYDALQSSGSCDAERVIKPNCPSDGCNCSNCFTRKPRKRKRLYSWQRRNGSAAGVNGQTHSLKHTADNISIGMNNGEFVSQTEEPCNVPVLSLKKSPSSVLDTSPSQDLLCGYVDSLIPRQAIFYNKEISENVFHRSSILLLFSTCQSSKCVNLLKWYPAIIVNRIVLKLQYHWMLQLVKNLVRNSKRCQYKKLFLKHCSVKSKHYVCVWMFHSTQAERETKRYDVFYYPKSVWRNLTSNTIASLNAQSFKILRRTSRRAIKHLYRSSRVRFLPKAKDIRPLVNFKSQSKDGILNKCHLVIKKLRDDNPEMFGSSVFDYDGVYKNLSSFMSSVRRQLKESKIYIVVADVSKAFDCVNHDVLLKIMDDVLKGDEYALRKCTKVIYSRSKNVAYRFDSNVVVSDGNGINDFSIQRSSGGGILVDQGTVSTIRKEELQRVLFEQVKCNILKIGQTFYLQQVGIAQGNKLSPNLCSLYYGHLENSVILNFLHDGNSGDAISEPEFLMMRFIDDFMFISLSKKHALNFFNRMRRGFVYYNTYMNDSKYGYNFNIGDNEQCDNRLYMGDDGVTFIPWSGLLINCENLEIQADYTRYLGITIISTITVKMHSSMKYLRSKLCHYMRPKCHPIFYDSNINSLGTVRLNIYQAFLLCAMKFHCYMRSMPYSSISKPELLHVIKKTFRYMHSLIVSRMQDMELQSNVRPVLKLRRKETNWLGLSAYIRVLQKKQSRYKDLLALLIAEAEGYGHMDRDSDSLCYAVDDSHSSMFWKFKY
ncbi:Telomerase reverse transcriptase [Triticum urartu]|uniref:Telomerase reverse transcriptase n=2 Tax=Triticum TaxID=4564 RepID=M7ZHR0_TRIUA|nr:Telomerase reverse transcriptase [Triticum urartu]